MAAAVGAPVPGLGARLNQASFIQRLSAYIPQKNLKALRRISRNWNAGIVESSAFQAKSYGHLDTTFYEGIAGLAAFSNENTVRFRNARIDHFVYRRASGEFKHFWNHAAHVLTHLSLVHCKFECDGFRFLIDHCPVLQSLHMQNVMLRDLDNYHGEDGKPPEGNVPGPDPVPVTVQLRHICFRSMFRIENCFMDYLISRTGSLESIEMTDCFMADDQNKILGRPRFQEHFREYLSNFIRLLARNQNTLRKLTFRVNQYQENLLGTLGQAIRGKRIPELYLDLLPDDYRGAIQMLNESSGVDSLYLHFRGRLSNDQLKNALKGLEGSLHKFELTYNGEHLNEILELDWLKGYPRLESLIVRDGKMLKYAETRRIVGGRRLARVGVFRRRRRFGWGRRNDDQLINITALLAKVTTKMTPSFLANLPPSCMQLGVHQYICKENILAVRPSNDQLALYRRLTKLDFRGPWIHSLAGVLNVLVAEMPQLRSLTVSDCGINDTILTGLSADMTLELNRCLTYGLVFSSNALQRTPEAVLQAVENTLRLPPTPDNYQGFTNLANLEHLDLASNPGISSLSIFYSLRLPKLKYLSLANCPRMSDMSLEFLSLYCPNLEVLDVKNCRNLSKWGMNKFVNKMKNLKSLYTTPFIKNRNMAGLNFHLCPDYDHVVVCVPPSRMEEIDKKVDYLQRNALELDRAEEPIPAPAT